MKFAPSVGAWLAKVRSPASVKVRTVTPLSWNTRSPVEVRLMTEFEVVRLVLVKVLLKVPAPVTVKALLTVVVPVEAPTLSVVAAPPRERVVTVVLKRVPVVVVEVISALVAPLTARSPLMVVSSERVIDEDPESITIFPVVEPPRVRVWAAVVWINPAAVKYVAPAAPAEAEAVGVPELIFKAANLAEVEAVAPMRRSTVALLGKSAPED